MKNAAEIEDRFQKLLPLLPELTKLELSFLMLSATANSHDLAMAVTILNALKQFDHKVLEPPEGDPVEFGLIAHMLLSAMEPRDAEEIAEAFIPGNDLREIR